MTQPLLAHPILWTPEEAWEFGDKSMPSPGSVVLIQLDRHICFGVFDFDSDGWIASEVDEPPYFSLLLGGWTVPEGVCRTPVQDYTKPMIQSIKKLLQGKTPTGRKHWTAGALSTTAGITKTMAQRWLWKWGQDLDASHP